MSDTPSRKMVAVERHTDHGEPPPEAQPVSEMQSDSAIDGDPATLALEVAAMREEMAGLKQQIADAVTAMTQISTSTPSASNQSEPAPSVPAPVANGAAGLKSDRIDNGSILAVQLEIAQLVRSIAQAKEELAAIKHPMADDDRLLAASNELDAIVRATEVATQDVLGAAEKIERITALISGNHPDDDELQAQTHQIINHIVSIMEASNFQDITGQRITKVVNTVRFIEERVLSMINIWGVEAFAELPMPTQETGTDDDLLNGPQLENHGISQADIDALFD